MPAFAAINEGKVHEDWNAQIGHDNRPSWRRTAMMATADDWLHDLVPVYIALQYLELELSGLHWCLIIAVRVQDDLSRVQVFAPNSAHVLLYNAPIYI